MASQQKGSRGASRLAVAAATLLGISAAQAGGARLEPPDGRTLMIVGQEREEIRAYWREVGPAGGYMLYSNIATLSGLEGPAKGRGCSDSGWMDLQDWVRNYPGTVAQIGLYMVGSTEDVARGELDHVVSDLGEILRAAKRPVFLRVGYEFDGPWNRYDAAIYQQAFRRVSDILRGRRAGREGRRIATDNVALVWHSAAYSRYEGKSLDAWYPGDEFVDWVALSWFPWASRDDERTAEEARAEVAGFARRHGKPLMIAEAAPKAYFEADGEESWRGWHQRVFDWIDANNVKAYSYINQNWTRMPQWQAACGQGGDWGDTRIQKPGSVLLERWRHELGKPRWIRQGDAELSALGTNPIADP